MKRQAPPNTPEALQLVEKRCFSTNMVPPVGASLDLLREIQELRCFFAAHVTEKTIF